MSLATRRLNQQGKLERKYILFSPKFVKFVLLGGVSYVFAFFQMFSYTQLLDISYAPAYAITQVCMYLLNFTLARHWIFHSVAENPYKQGIKFFFAVVIFRFIDWCLFILLTNYIGIKYYLSIFLAMAFVFLFKYFAYKKKVFSDK